MLLMGWMRFVVLMVLGPWGVVLSVVFCVWSLLEGRYVHGVEYAAIGAVIGGSWYLIVTTPAERRSTGRVSRVSRRGG